MDLSGFTAALVADIGVQVPDMLTDMSGLIAIVAVLGLVGFVLFMVRAFFTGS